MSPVSQKLLSSLQVPVSLSPVPKRRLNWLHKCLNLVEGMRTMAWYMDSRYSGTLTGTSPTSSLFV
jgi:hypothetical protein